MSDEAKLSVAVIYRRAALLIRDFESRYDFNLSLQLECARFLMGPETFKDCNRPPKLHEIKVHVAPHMPLGSMRLRLEMETAYPEDFDAG